jgi:large subunit ribosomal protein L6
MSRLGRIPVQIPKGVKVSLTGTLLSAEGPKGKLVRNVPAGIVLKVEGEKAVVSRTDDLKPTRAAHGLVRSLLNGMVKGVSEGFSKTLVSVGVGYRMALTGNKLNISAGLSHPVVFSLPTGVQGKVEDQTRLVLTGIDKELIGLVADRIRSVRPPEPYKGKGIRYDKEVIQLKEGKAAGKGAK